MVYIKNYTLNGPSDIFLPSFCCHSDESTILTQFQHQVSTSLLHNMMEKNLKQLNICDKKTVPPSSRLWSMLSDWSSSAASLVQIIAVAAGGPIVALAKLPDPTASLQHHLLRHRHHNAKEVGILKRLGEDRTWIHGIKCNAQILHFYLNLTV